MFMLILWYWLYLFW